MLHFNPLIMPLLTQASANSEVSLRLWALDNASITNIAERYGDLSLQLLVLLFLVSIGIYALRAFQGLDLEGKVLDLMLCGLFILMWPLIVTNMKWAVDSFNDYLVTTVFKNQTLHQAWPNTQLLLKQAWGEGVDGMTSQSGVLGNLGSQLILNFLTMGINLFIGAAKVIVEVFYNAFFYFFTLLGPFVIARSIFSDHLEGFFELVKEFLIVMLWPTTFVLLRGMNGLAVPTASQVGLWGELGFQLSMIVLTFFVPSLTKKFCSNIGASIISPLLRFTGIALGLTGLQGLASGAGRAIAGAGFHGFHFAHTAEKYISLGEIIHEHSHVQHAHHLAHKLHHALHGAEHAAHHAHEHHEHHDEHDHHGERHEHHAEHTHDEAHAEHHDHHAGHSPDHESHDAHHEASAHHAATEPHQSHAQKGQSPKALFKISDKLASLSSPPSPAAVEADGGQAPTTSPKIEAFSWKAPLGGLAWLNRLSKSFQKAPTEADMKLERDRARACLGPKGSDKDLDMQKCGIDHRALISNDFATLKDYRRMVEKFHSKYGWLYDFQGHFLGFADQRPGSKNFDFQKDFDND